MRTASGFPAMNLREETVFMSRNTRVQACGEEDIPPYGISPRSRRS